MRTDTVGYDIIKSCCTCDYMLASSDNNEIHYIQIQLFYVFESSVNHKSKKIL